MESSIGTSCIRYSIIVRLCGEPAGGPGIKNMKFYVRTYGCQMNVADSNEMGRHLKANGLVETQDPGEASVMLVNTCTVRHHAENRAFSEIGRLRHWKTKRPGRKI